MKVLVTGAAGFIGGQLMHALPVQEIYMDKINSVEVKLRLTLYCIDIR